MVHGEGQTSDPFESLVVVLDVNVWIDGCLAVRRGVDLSSRWRIVSSGTGREVRSLATISGLAAPSSSHLVVGIDNQLIGTVLRKLTQPGRGDRDEDKGEGWPLADARTAMRSLLYPIQDAGRIYEVIPPAGEGPIGDDHEDKRIWGLFDAVRGAHETCVPVLVTYDGPFAREAMAAAPPLKSLVSRRERPGWIVGPPDPLLERLQRRAE